MRGAVCAAAERRQAPGGRERARTRLAGALPGGRAAEHRGELGGHARRVAKVVARARRRAPVRVGVVAAHEVRARKAEARTVQRGGAQPQRRRSTAV